MHGHLAGFIERARAWLGTINRESRLITIEQVTRMIRNELRGKLPADTVIDENSKLADLGLSSLQIAELVFELEEEHGVEFDAAQAADAQTLGDVIALGNLAITSQVG